MLTPKRTAAPAEQPVSLSDAKLHLRVDHSDDDTLITALISAATEALDGWSGVLGRCVITQTWKLVLSGFCSGRIIRLPFPDVVEDIVVKYFDAGEIEQTFPSTAYQVLEDASGSFVWLKSGEAWPTTFDRLDAVSIEFDAGFGDASSTPAPIKAAILLIVGHLYENREDVSASSRMTSLPKGADYLLAPYRRVQI